MRGGPCFGSFGKLGPALFYNFHHPVTLSVLLVHLPEYEDLTLCEEKMRGLRAQMSPFNVPPCVARIPVWRGIEQVLRLESIINPHPSQDLVITCWS
jgi:hypothetical protein